MMCTNTPESLVAKETNLEKEKAEVGSDKEMMKKKEQRKTELWMVEKIIHYSQGFAFLLLLYLSPNETRLPFPLLFCWFLWLSCWSVRYILGYPLPAYYYWDLPFEILATAIMLGFNRFGIRSFKSVPASLFVVPNLAFIIMTCVIMPSLEEIYEKINFVTLDPTNPNSKESSEKEGLKKCESDEHQADDVGVEKKNNVYVVETTPTAKGGDDYFVHIQVDENDQIMVASQEDSIKSVSIDLNIDYEEEEEEEEEKDSIKTFSIDLDMDNEEYDYYDDDDLLGWPEELVSDLIAAETDDAAAAANPTPFSKEQDDDDDDVEEDENEYKRFECYTRFVEQRGLCYKQGEEDLVAIIDHEIEDFEMENQKWEEERKHLVSELNDAKSLLQHQRDMFDEDRCKWEEEKAQLILNISSQELLNDQNHKWKEERIELVAKLNYATSLLQIQKESFDKDRCKWQEEKAHELDVEKKKWNEEKKELNTLINDALSLLQMVLNSKSQEAKEEEKENHNKEDTYFFDKERRSKWELEDKASSEESSSSSSSESSSEEEEEEEEKWKWEEEKKDLILELNNAKTLLENHKDTVDSFNEDRCKWEEEKAKLKEEMLELSNKNERNTADLIKVYEVESNKWKEEKEELVDKLQGAKESSKYYKRAMIEAENLRIKLTDQHNDVVARLERANADADHYHSLLHLYYDHYYYQQQQNQAVATNPPQQQQQQQQQQPSYSCAYYYNNAHA